MTPIIHRHDDLPLSTLVEGVVPDAEPRYVGVLVERWAAADAAEGPRPTALGTRYRHSDAGRCARALAYRAGGIAETDPMDLTGTWATRIGTMIHDAWQEALSDLVNCETEVVVRVSDDFDGSGHADARIDRKGERICYELKTVGGYAFKAAVGRARRGAPAEGPKTEHVTQLALNAVADDADEAILGYLSRESISVRAGAGLSPLGRMAAEWSWPTDTLRPIAEAELARVGAILDLVDGAGLCAARKIPSVGHGEIVDPARGRWEHVVDGRVVDSGAAWQCDYCPWQRLCALTGPGRVTVESVQEIRSTL